MKKLLLLLPFLAAFLPGCADLRTEKLDTGLLMGIAADPTLSAVQSGLFVCTTLDHDTLPPHPGGRSISSTDPHSRSVTVNGKLWPVAKTLRVKLTGGTAQQLAYVRQAADSISAWANINYDFNQNQSTFDYRMTFVPGQGSWSYIGTDCQYVGQQYATCNIGWVAFDATLHEMMHGIGFAHEQASPNATIPWNKPVVYAELAGPPNYWSASTVDGNVFYRYSATSVTASVFDPVSIMQYSVKASWTLDNQGIPGGKNLSKLDRKALVDSYPGRVPPVIVIPPTGTGIQLTPAQVALIVQYLNGSQLEVDSTAARQRRNATRIKKLVGQ